MRIVLLRKNLFLLLVVVLVVAIVVVAVEVVVAAVVIAIGLVVVVVVVVLVLVLVVVVVVVPGLVNTQLGTSVGKYKLGVRAGAGAQAKTPFWRFVKKHKK